DPVCWQLPWRRKVTNSDGVRKPAYPNKWRHVDKNLLNGNARKGGGTVENLRRVWGETWRTHSCVPRRDSSRRLCLDGSIGQQAPREVSARHARVRAPRLRRWAAPRALRVGRPMGTVLGRGTV